MDYADCVVIIPCYNEEKSIVNTVDQVKKSLPKAKIIVIDNASTDETSNLAEQSGAFVLYESRKGKGYAVRQAFQYIHNLDYKVALMIDGDATYSIQNFEEAYELITVKNSDMVVGTRVVDSEIEEGRSDPYRKFHSTGNLILTKLNKILFGIEISDTLSGWRAFSPNFVRSFSGGLSAFEIESELNIHAFVLSCPISNIDVSYVGRLHGSESKLNTVSDGIRILRCQLRLFRSERPRVAFSLLGIPWFILSFTLVTNVILEFLKTKLVPNFPSLIAGVAAFIVSALLWTTGMILENVRLGRVQETFFQYRNIPH